MKKVITVIVLLAICVSLFAACGGSSPIIGKWGIKAYIDGEDLVDAPDGNIIMIFEEGGKATAKFSGSKDEDIELSYTKVEYDEVIKYIEDSPDSELDLNNVYMVGKNLLYTLSKDHNKLYSTSAIFERIK